PGQFWLLYGKHGKDTLFRQYKNESPGTQEQMLRMLQTVAEALNQLPISPSFQYVSHFALRVSGDPHFLDSNTVGGRLFLSALVDLRALAASEISADTQAEDQQAGETQAGDLDHWRHLLYYDTGLLLDDISSTVAVFRLG